MLQDIQAGKKDNKTRGLFSFIDESKVFIIQGEGGFAMPLNMSLFLTLQIPLKLRKSEQHSLLKRGFTRFHF